MFVAVGVVLVRVWVGMAVAMVAVEPFVVHIIISIVLMVTLVGMAVASPIVTVVV